MKIAMISAWHVHAKGCAKKLLAMPECEIVAVWDENAERGALWAQDLGCRFFPDYDLLLQDKSIDGVVINSPTAMHAELMIKAAKAGKHIYTEKVLALTVADCVRIKEAIEQNKVKFTIALPHKCRADLLFAKQMIDSGALGDITYARVRNAHNGSIGNWLPEHFYNKEQCGGGAMIDLGAHTMYLLEWFLGKPKSVVSTYTKVSGRAVEDNAVSVLEFANGAIGVAETSFVSVYNPMTVELSGTKGSMLVKGEVMFANQETEGRWELAEHLPEALPDPMVQWVEGVTRNKEIHLGIEDAISLTVLLNAAYEAENSGVKVYFKA